MPEPEVDPGPPMVRITVRIDEEERKAIDTIRTYLKSIGPFRPFAGSDGECVRYALRCTASYVLWEERNAAKARRKAAKKG